ncbi:MAG TPA: SDR family oxidoreductase [Rectinemataceae bacterium]|nr:SDR family oxidoreductase [Rectinemataceae bacterium]
MNILLTGASGLLGRPLLKQLAGLKGLTRVIGTAHSRLKAPLESLDITDEKAVRLAFDRWTPDLVIHAAAERRPDVVDQNPALAERLNVGATSLLARLTAERGARFVYISTDYVFNGSSPPYGIDAATEPLNAYGRMKLAGERAVHEAYGKGSELQPPSTATAVAWAVIRIPILYGDVEALAESPVTELAIRLLERRPFKAEDWASRYPAHAEDVARAVALAAQRLASGEGGLYHFAGAERFTKYGMACVMADILGLDRSLVQPDPHPPAGAPRPKDCRLDGSRLTSLGFAPQIPFQEGIRRALAPFMA